MKKMKFFFTAAALLLSVLAFAQNITVKGVVTDATSGEPLPGAAILVKGTSDGVVADFDGNYSITVPANATLGFTTIGFKDQEVAVAGRTEINVKLEPDSEMLEGTVVVGYGSAKKVGNLVGSIKTVKSDIVKNAPSSSALDQLQGQVAGLSVLTTGGVAGDNSVSMTLHGVGSLGSSSAPLYVIDGIPSSSRAIMAMNSNDILSISILKDASATSIYGSRAANGVVYVVTKSGSYSTDATVTVRSQYGISTLANPSLYESMMTGDELKDFWIRAGIYTPAQIKANYTDQGYDANTQWYKIFQQLNTPQYQNDVTIEGGGQKVAYLVSASQFHQTGTTVGNFYDRYTVRSNVQGHPKNWIKIGMNINLSLDRRQQNPNWGDSQTFDANYTSGGLSYLQNPLYPAYDEDGKLFDPKFPSGTSNPYTYMANTYTIRNSYGLTGGTYVEIEPLKNFKIRSQVGTDTRFFLNNGIALASSPFRSGTGQKAKSSQITSNNTLTNTAEYAFTIANDHAVSVLAGQEWIRNWYDTFSGSSSGQNDDRLLNLGDGTQNTFSLSESSSESQFLSFFGHADYSYLGKYNVDATIRNDASSRFGIDSRNATFWSIGAKWNGRKENFVKNTPWLQDLTAKISYGTQGNASIGDYSHLALIGKTANYADAIGWGLAQPSNNQLTWEKQKLFTVGFSTRVFNAIDLEVEYYNRVTTDMLMSVPYPYTAGFSSLTDNVGGLTNSGVDITLGVDILSGADYYLRFNAIFNYNKEVVSDLFEAAWDEDLQRYRWEMPSAGLAYVQGLPVSYYAPIFAGIDPTDGAPTWYVPSDDPDVTTMDPDNITKNFDESALLQNTGKKLNAPINGGFGLEGAWKFLSFRADFSYVLGKTLMNNDKYFYANPAQFAGMNTYKGVSDYWTPENTDAPWPDWSQGYVMEFDTHLYENASFLRLKSLQFGVALPNKWLESQKVFKGVKLTFTGRNLFTATKYTGIDPEIDMNLSMGIPGNTKQILGGLELTF